MIERMAMTEEEALRWLFGFADWERGVGWNPRSGADPAWNLGRTRWLLDAVGAPDRSIRTALIAGTKGKGSTSALLESAVRASGVRTGLYTQPHLRHYRERIRLDGAPIEPAPFCALAGRFREPVERLSRERPEAGEPTTFEITTAMALAAFADHDAEVAVVEVGLGGRLDATNCLSPTVSVITNISYDHTQILGGTLARIATEKAGIARPGVPLISAPQRPSARQTVSRICRLLGTPCRFVAPFESANGSQNRGGQRICLRLFGQSVGEAFLALEGPHQRENAAVAVAAAEVLAEQGLVDLTSESLRRGLEGVRWPGRYEVVPGVPRIILDAAHNGRSAERLAETLRDESFGKLWLVLGVLRDKDARGVLRPLLPIMAGVIVTTSQSPRALPVSDLVSECHRLGARRIERAGSVRDALAVARSRAAPDDVICVTGSMTVVAEARDALALPSDAPLRNPGERTTLNTDLGPKER